MVNRFLHFSLTTLFLFLVLPLPLQLSYCSVRYDNGERFWVLLVSSSWPPFFPLFYSQSLLSISRSHQCSALPLTGRMRQISVIVTPWINQKGMLCEGLGWPALPWCVTPALCPASTGPGRGSPQADPEPQSLVWHHTSGPAKGKHFQIFFRLQQSILHSLVPAHILLGKTYLVTAEMFIDVGFHSINRGANRCTQELCDINLITTHGGLFVL